MKCPIDQATLLITDRSGIEIDYCPECRGVWLDKGELDKIIDRNADAARSPAGGAQYSNGGRASDSHDKHVKYGSYDGNNPQYKKKRRESFLGDLFDF